MIIDFHTHIFPDKLAPRALSSLAKRVGYEPFGNGTVSDLIQKMDEGGIDKAVVCNIATNPKQQTNVNNFALETMAQYPDRLIPLASINPYSDTGSEELCRLKSAGIPGIKLHPDYMGLPIDAPEYDRIFDLCTELDLFIIIHAGFDVYSPDKIHASPDRILRRLNKNPGIRLVCAHYGSNMMWDEVERKLCGKNLWIDTSMGVLEGLSPEQARRIIDSHDPSKVLFATDFPWCGMRENINFIRSLGFSDEINEKIFHHNAEELMKISFAPSQKTF